MEFCGSEGVSENNTYIIPNEDPQNPAKPLHIPKAYRPPPFQKTLLCVGGRETSLPPEGHEDVWGLLGISVQLWVIIAGTDNPKP